MDNVPYEEPTVGGRLARLIGRGLFVLACMAVGGVLGMGVVLGLSLLGVDLDFHVWWGVSPYLGAVAGLVCAIVALLVVRKRKRRRA